jgi:universal stress protein E
MVDSERLMMIASPIMHRTPAFDRAGALAKAMDASLHIVAFDYVDGLATAGLVNEKALAEMREGYVERHRQWLEEQAESIRRTGVQVTTEVVWVLRAFTEIMVHIRELSPSMVIKDLEHESWITRALFTSLDLRLLHECPVPLHLVSHVTHAKPRKVLAAVDPFRPDEQFDDINGEIISAAEKLAAQCGAELHLLYAYDLSYVFASGGYDGFSSDLAQQLYDTDAMAFRKLVDRFGVPGNRQHLVMGNPAKQIEALVESEGIDVVVMGTVHRRHTLRLLGSTTEQVAYHVPCSLLAIRPHAPDE